MSRNVMATPIWVLDAGVKHPACGARTRANAILAFYAASAGELPAHRSLLAQRFREASAIVGIYLEGRAERPEQLAPAELAGAYRLALDLHGIVCGVRTGWSQDWRLELVGSGTRLYEAAQLAKAYRPHTGSIPTTRMAALSVSAALITEVSLWHHRAAKPACASDFTSLLQAAAVGLALHREQSFGDLGDFEILKLACDAYQQYGGLCWSQAQPTTAIN